MTDMNVSGQRFNGIKHGWSSVNNEEDSMEVINVNEVLRGLIFYQKFP